MRVKVYSTAAGPWGVLLGGASGLVPDEVGRAMIASGAAEEVSIEAEPFEEPALSIPPVQTAAAEPDENAVMKDPPKRRRVHATVQKPGMPTGNGR